MNTISSLCGLREAVQANRGLLAILFAIPRHPPSLQMMPVCTELAKEFDETIKFAICELTILSPQSRATLDIQSAPQFWILRGTKRVVKTEGANGHAYYQQCHKLSIGQENNNEEQQNDSNTDVLVLIDEALKTIENQAAEITKSSPLIIAARNEGQLESLNKELMTLGIDDFVQYEDEDLFEKFIKDWQQDAKKHLFIIVILNGKLHTSEDFLTAAKNKSSVIRAEALSASKQMKEKLDERLKRLINKSQVMLFMKGTKEAPFCKFSRELVRLLNEAKIDFDYFNILEDPKVREGLKRYSEWPTYPQLYVNGELIGGLDIVRDIIQNVGGIENLAKELLTK